MLLLRWLFSCGLIPLFIKLRAPSGSRTPLKPSDKIREPTPTSESDMRGHSLLDLLDVAIRANTVAPSVQRIVAEGCVLEAPHIKPWV